MSTSTRRVACVAVACAAVLLGRSRQAAAQLPDVWSIGQTEPNVIWVDQCTYQFAAGTDGFQELSIQASTPSFPQGLLTNAQADLSAYLAADGYLEFWVKGPSVGDVEIGFEATDWPDGMAAIRISDYVTVDDTWQVVVVPLSDLEARKSLPTWDFTQCPRFKWTDWESPGFDFALKRVRVTTAPGLPQITVQATDAEAAEEGADAGTFTISRTGPTTEALDVTVAISGTAVAADYAETLSTTVTIPVDQASATVTVTPDDDAEYEGDETVVLTVEEGGGGDYIVGDPASDAITIVDNDAATVTITASLAQISEGDSETEAFTIVRSGGPASDVTVTISIGGDATEGAAGDYTLSAGGSPVTVAAGEATVAVPPAGLVISVVPVDDPDSEPTETIQIDIVDDTGSPKAYFLGSPVSASVEMVDDEMPEVTLTVTVDTAVEHATSPVPGVLTVARTGDTASALTVDFTVSGTAVLSDYQPIGTSVDVPAGSATVTIDIVPVDNAVQVGDRTVIVTLAENASVYVRGDPFEGTVTIQEDDVYIQPISLVSPDGTQDLEVDAAQTFEWSGGGGAVSFTVTISTDGVGFSDPITLPCTGTSVDLAEGRLLYEETYYWKVTGFHAQASIDSDEVFSFDTLGDSKPPTVRSTDPSGGSNDASVSQTIKVNFSEPMDRTSTLDAFELLDSLDVPVPGTKDLSLSGYVLTFDPDDDLDFNATYRITVAGTAIDQATNPNELDGNEDGTGGDAFEATFETQNPLSGVGAGGGCAAGAATAGGGLVAAVLGLLLAGRRRRG